MTHPLNSIVRGLFKWVTPVGSRVTCVPAPTDTDEDFLAFFEIDPAELDKTMNACGWSLGGSLPTDENSCPADERFWSYTNGEVNLIVTKSETFHRRFLAATAVAKRLNLLQKPDRITLFQAVLYGNS